MPKRKQENDYDHLAKKLKKIKHKMKQARQRRKSTSSLSSNSDTQAYISPEYLKSNTIDNEEVEVYSPGCSSWYDFFESSNETPRAAEIQNEVPSRPRSVVTAVPPPPPLQLPPPPPPPPSPPVAATCITPLKVNEDSSAQQIVDSLVMTADNIASEPQAIDQALDIDPALIEILGEDPTCTKEYGPDIQKDLAVRLNHIVTTGLSKDIRKEIKEKYLIPGNCKLLKGPVINPEIRASLVESQVKRDKGIENKQNMTSCALSSLSMALTMLLSSDNKDPEVLKVLMDTARILADLQYGDTVLRRFFILSTVKKDLKEQLEKTKIDDLLFGASLSETLKFAKNISKSGADIRSASSIKPNVGQTAPRTHGRPLNYRGAPARGRGAAFHTARGARPPPPPPPVTPRQTTTTRATPYSASRTSSRQPHTRARR